MYISLVSSLVWGSPVNLVLGSPVNLARFAGEPSFHSGIVYVHIIHLERVVPVDNFLSSPAACSSFSRRFTFALLAPDRFTRAEIDKSAISVSF